MADEGSAYRYERVPHVERRLSGGRRLVQAIGSENPTQLAGSAPLIWDLLVDFPIAEQLAVELQRQFSDPPEVIAAGVEAGLRSLIDASLVVAT